MSDYAEFLEAKAHTGSQSGFTPIWMPDFLFDFQAMLTNWNIRQGRAATLADCGLGKSPISLVYGENVVRHTNKPFLILTPLAVVQQFVREGAKFDIETNKITGGSAERPAIFVTNYEKLHLLSPDDYSGAACDEASCLKSLTGARRAEVTQFLRKIPYRLLCTATAAPNDYPELGTLSEALGELGLTDMLGRFFRDEGNRAVTGNRGRDHRGSKWRFKGHAEKGFWQWVCSWARACRKPSDLGFSDERFVLPPLIEREHIIKPRKMAPGKLFNVPARDMREEREERRRTIHERCEKAAELATAGNGPVVIWCHLNDEADLLEKLIPDSRQISGTQADEDRQEIYEAFSGRQLERIIIKDRIGAWGLNWEFCSRVIRFPTHSWESHYQAIRRCWRFGQKNPVTVDLIASEGEEGIKDNLRRKSENADRMFTNLVAFMNDALRIEKRIQPSETLEVPAWL